MYKKNDPEWEIKIVRKKRRASHKRVLSVSAEWMAIQAHVHLWTNKHAQGKREDDSLPLEHMNSFIAEKKKQKKQNTHTPTTRGALIRGCWGEMLGNF